MSGVIAEGCKAPRMMGATTQAQVGCCDMLVMRMPCLFFPVCVAVIRLACETPTARGS